MATAIFVDWTRGLDFTLGDFCLMLILIPFGLLFVFWFLVEVWEDKMGKIYKNKNKIILSARKSAKMHKALIADNWPS
jgi:hypothetical protein